MHVGVHGSLEVPAAPASGRSASDARNSLWRSWCRIQMSISHGTLGLNSHKLPSLQGNDSPEAGLVMGLLRVPIHRAAPASTGWGGKAETSKCAEYKGHAWKHKCPEATTQYTQCFWGNSIISDFILTLKGDGRVWSREAGPNERLFNDMRPAPGNTQTRN